MKVRTNFANAFGVTFSQGTAPLTKEERLELSGQFHRALRACVSWRRRQVSRRSQQTEKSFSSQDFQLKDEDLDAAFVWTFKKWKARDYDSSTDGKEMKKLRKIMATDTHWLVGFKPKSQRRS